MNALADVWVGSGKDSKCLYRGKRKVIIAELKSWVQRRKTLNDFKIAECWDVLHTEHLHRLVEAQCQLSPETESQAIWDQLGNVTAIQMKNWIRMIVSHSTRHSES